MSYQYAYNGLGNRLQQTHNGQTIPYTLDLNAGLTQVLSDGTYTYLYGYRRIAQSGASGMEYFLPDALGSVRQMTDGVGGVTLSQSFTPYGELLARGGIGSTAYDFAGEWMDPSGLQYLRARYYAPNTGTFISRDPWGGNVRQPLSLNRYLYVKGNPVNFSDPSGLCRPDDYACQKVADRIFLQYRIIVNHGLDAIPYWASQYIWYHLDENARCTFSPYVSNSENRVFFQGRSLPWNTHELESIEKVLKLAQYVFGNNFGRLSWHTSISKVFLNENKATNPDTVINHVDAGLGTFYRHSNIELPLGFIKDGSLEQIGGGLFHEIMHAYDNSYWFSPTIGETTLELSSSSDWDPIYERNPIWDTGWCGPSRYACSSNGEFFAESAAVYALYRVTNNLGTPNDVKQIANRILLNYKDAGAKAPNNDIRLPSKWGNLYNHTQDILDEIFQFSNSWR